MGPLDEDTPRWSPSGAPRECNGANLAVLEPPESADAAASAEGRAFSAAARRRSIASCSFASASDRDPVAPPKREFFAGG